MSRDRVILVGAAAMGAYVAELLGDYERDAQQIVIQNPPDFKAIDFPIDIGNRKERRSYSPKKQRLKGLRP